MTTSGNVRGVLLCAASAALVAGVASPATAAQPPPQSVTAQKTTVRAAVPPVLIGLPAAPAGTTLGTARVTGVSSLGLLAGTAEFRGGAETDRRSYAFRWLPAGTSRWVRQRLADPSPTPSAVANGITEYGEVGGSIGGTFTDISQRKAVRWAVTGRSSAVLGPAGSEVTAVGPRGPFGVSIADLNGQFDATGALVARDGSRTPLTGTPEVAFARALAPVSVPGPSLALLRVLGGVGFGTSSTPVLWQQGRTLALPVRSSLITGTDCVSKLTTDGSVAYSGKNFASSDPVVGIHRGGVPGSTVTPDLLGGVGTLACGGPDTIDADGSAGGTLALPGKPSRATVWRDGRPTSVPLRTGETSSQVVGLASGGRVLVQAVTAEGSQRLYVWRDGVVTPLTLPKGFIVGDVLDFSDRGLVVANLSRTGSFVATQPYVWRVPA